MSKVAVVITDMFEDSEYAQPAEAFKKAGHELIHVGLKSGVTVKGKKQETPVKVDKTAKEVKVGDFDALLIPGGYSPDKLRVDDHVVRFVKEFVESGKPVCAICHAPTTAHHRPGAQRAQDYRLEILGPGYQKCRGRIY